MPGIDERVIEHSLNIDPMKKPIQQKRQVFTPEQNKAVMEEVEKLLTAGFIQVVYYLEWLEKTEKWTGYWFSGQTGDIIINIIFKILNYINKNIISLLLII